MLGAAREREEAVQELAARLATQARGHHLNVVLRVLRQLLQPACPRAAPGPKGSRLPVSTTHAIVGGVVGTTLAAVGGGCLNWDFDGGLGGIVASWVLSPVASGICAALLYKATFEGVLKNKETSYRNAKYAFPIIVGFTIGVNMCFFIPFGFLFCLRF